MYNFAQALSAGYVKLIDWKSIETANMATVEFKTQLLEAAVAAGTVEKTADGMYRVLGENGQGKTMNEAIDATNNFNDSLQYQWMTTEVLVNTLRDYADETTDMTNIQPFLNGAASIDPATLEGVKSLSEVILILTAADILDGLTSWFTGGSSLSGFANELVPFGTAMKAFSEEIAGIDGNVISNAATAGKTLAEMAETLPGSGGVVQFFAGEHNMAVFGEQLIPFGKAMKEFGNTLAGIDESVISGAATAGKSLAEMANTVPNSGGVIDFFTGGNDLDTFGEQLIPFGKAMKEFSLAVTGINADVIVNSATAGNINIISPDIADRKIENFIFTPSTDSKVTSLTLEHQYTGDNLYTVIQSLCEENNIGFKIVLNSDNQFEFSLYAGVDRSYGQTDNPYVVFSPNFENIINSNYYSSKAGLKNVTLVAGEGEGSSRKTTIVGSGVGIDRREIFTDAREISSETEEKTLTDVEYEAMLVAKGQKTLAENNKVTAFEGEVETTRSFKYGEDFFVGDIVQIANEYGNEGSAYISELIFSKSKDGKTIYPTFKAVD